MTNKELLEYEIHASWWVSWIGIPVLQRWAGSYYAWKVNRKAKRYRQSLKRRDEVNTWLRANNLPTFNGIEQR